MGFLSRFHNILHASKSINLYAVLCSNVTEVTRYVISLELFPSNENVMEITSDK